MLKYLYFRRRCKLMRLRMCLVEQGKTEFIDLAIKEYVSWSK